MNVNIYKTQDMSIYININCDMNMYKNFDELSSMFSYIKDVIDFFNSIGYCKMKLQDLQILDTNNVIFYNMIKFTTTENMDLFLKQCELFKLNRSNTNFEIHAF